MVAELACLALAVYYEARSEPVSGQIAVAQVIMNRVRDPRFPKTVCGVVHQGPTSSTGMPLRHQCQFSFWCDGLGEEPRDMLAWHRAQIVSKLVYNGIAVRQDLVGVVHYHTLDAQPRWSSCMTEAVRIGNHVFMREPHK